MCVCSGFEMLALGPLMADNDTILVALRNHSSSNGSSGSSGGGGGKDGSNPSGVYDYSYYAASLDRRNPQDSPPKVSAAVFWCVHYYHTTYCRVHNHTSCQTVHELKTCYVRLTRWPQDDSPSCAMTERAYYSI